MATVLHYHSGLPAGDRDRSQPTYGSPAGPQRYRPISMQLVAFLDAHYVELRIETDDGHSFVLSCPAASICDLQRHIETITAHCPEILEWNHRTHGKSASIMATNTGLPGIDAMPMQAAIT